MYQSVLTFYGVYCFYFNSLTNHQYAQRHATAKVPMANLVIFIISI